MKPLSQASARYIILMVAGGYIVVLGLIEGARGVGALDTLMAGEVLRQITTVASLSVGRRAWLLHSLPPASKLTSISLFLSTLCKTVLKSCLSTCGSPANNSKCRCCWQELRFVLCGKLRVDSLIFCEVVRIKALFFRRSTRRQGDPRRRTNPGLALDRQLPAVLVDNVSANEESPILGCDPRPFDVKCRLEKPV